MTRFRYPCTAALATGGRTRAVRATKASATAPGRERYNGTS